ncbi:MAG: hypothetical protein HYR98_07580 [Nitrospirae bacterium]|nr:hypothetical protein [Nitrospirota bacterium]
MTGLFSVVVSLVLVLVFSYDVQAEGSFLEHRYPYTPNEALPGADRFVKKQGYWEGYKGNKMVGVVLLSKDWTPNLVGYAGKHLETLIGMDTAGNLTGVKVVFHAEPIVMIGLKEDNYKTFIRQYVGKSIKEKLAVGSGISMDAITGATVTAVVQNSIVLGSARRAALKSGMLQARKTEAPRQVSQAFTAQSWKELLDKGAVQRITIKPETVGLKAEAQPYLDLYFALADPPAVGRNLLGANAYEQAKAALGKRGGSILVVVSSGPGSFKGTGFVRGGIFDRFHLEQEAKSFIFRDVDYTLISEIKAAGAPPIREGGIFLIHNKDFDPGDRFAFNLVLPVRVGTTSKEVKSFEQTYRLPDAYMEKAK